MGVFTGDPNKKVDISSANLEGTGGSTESTTGELAPQNQQKQDTDPHSILNIAPPGASPQEAEMIKRRANDLYNQDPLLYDDTQTQDLFPGLAPIRQVGGYSGSIVGHSAKYAGGVNVLPVGAILERKKAKARAAAAKAKAMAEIKLPTIDRYKKAVSAQKNLDKSFNQVTNRFWEQAVKDFGPEYAKIALTSTDTALGRDYLNFAQDMNTLVAEGDKVFTMLEEVDADLKKGGVVFSPKMRDIRNAVYQAQGELEMDGELNPFKLAEYVKNIKDLKGFYTMEKMVHDRGLDKIKGEIMQRAGINPANADYLTEWSKKTVEFDKYIGEIAKQLSQGELSEQVTEGIYSEKDIENYLKNILGREEIETRSAKMMSEGGGGRTTTKDIDQAFRGGKPSEYRFEYTDHITGQTQTSDMPFVPDVTFSEKSGKVSITNPEIVTNREGDTQKRENILQANFKRGGRTGLMPVVIVSMPEKRKQKVRKEKEEGGEVVPVLDEQGRQIYEEVETEVENEVPIKYNDAVRSSVLSNWKAMNFGSKQDAEAWVKQKDKELKEYEDAVEKDKEIRRKGYEEGQKTKTTSSKKGETKQTKPSAY